MKKLILMGTKREIIFENSLQMEITLDFFFGDTWYETHHEVIVIDGIPRYTVVNLVTF